MVLSLIMLAFQSNASGNEKTQIYIAGFENKSGYQEKKDEFKKKLFSVMAETLKEKGMQIRNDKKGCDYLLEGTILLFSLEKKPEVIPFVNRWRNVTTSLVKVRIRLTDLKSNQVILDTKEFAELSRKGKEQVDFNVGKETPDNMEPNEAVCFDTGFNDTLMGQCTINTLEKLSDKITAAISAAGKNK